MDKAKILSYGYIFKELPPPFNSLSFGTNCSTIGAIPTISTKAVEYSIPKGKYSRRLLHLPNPISFLELVNHLCNPLNWKLLEKHFKKSSISHSKVFENKKAGKNILNKDNRAIITNYMNVSDSKEQTILDSFDMIYELRIDIAKYYPSIYTHSFTWAILGKERAKELWKLKGAKSKEKDFPLYSFADKLDIIVRGGQDNQSVGIPIGPDTSHILSEIIGTYIDIQFKSKFPDAKVVRYFDDYHIYIETEESAQRALKYIQKILADLQLSINETKLKIQKFPFPFQDLWIKEINSVKIYKIKASKIKQYFNTLFDLAKRYPDNSGTIFNYGLKTFEKRTVEIDKDSWDVFESLLLKSMLIEPSILEIASRLFETYKMYISKVKIQSVLLKILDSHCDLNHHYETVWALWIFKQLKLPKLLCNKIIDTGDNFSILLLLDLNSEKLVLNRGLSIKSVQNIVDLLNMDKTTNWLLYYEAVEIKKWISASKRSEFLQLKKAKVSFYNKKENIRIFHKSITTKTFPLVTFSSLVGVPPTVT